LISSNGDKNKAKQTSAGENKVKIKTRLKLNNWLTSSAMILIVLSLVWSWTAMRRADENLLLVHQMEKTSLERIILAADWFLNKTERAKIQWHKKSQELRLLLEKAARKFPDPAAQNTLRAANEDFEATFALAALAMEKADRATSPAPQDVVATERAKKIITQASTRAYALSGNIGRLREIAQNEAFTARNRVIAAILIFAAVAALGIFFNSTLVNLIVQSRVEQIRKGLTLIHDGHLDHRLPIKGNDELSELAGKINELAEKLNTSYTSIDHLHREIAERKKAETNLKRLYAREQALLAAVPDIIMEVDQNKIYTWANEPGLAFFGKDVLGKEASFYFADGQKTYATVEPLFHGSEDMIYLESWQRRQDGQKRLLAWWCKALKDERGNVIGAISTARDITEQKLAAEEIKKLNEELEQRVARRTAELAAKTAELERINKVFVDRELKMRELKEKIAQMENQNKKI